MCRYTGRSRDSQSTCQWLVTVLNFVINVQIHWTMKGQSINLPVTGDCAHLCDKCADTLDDVGTVMTFDDNIKVHDDPFGFLPVSRATHLLKTHKDRLAFRCDDA